MDITKISGNKSFGMGLKTRETTTVAININGFLSRDITFENTMDPKMEHCLPKLQDLCTQAVKRNRSRRSMEKPSIMSYIGIMLSLISALHCVYTQQTLIVAKDGTGQFTTVSQAVAAAPNYSSRINYIKIGAGVYHEHVIIPSEKINLHLLGDGMDRTIITGNRSTNMGWSATDTAIVYIIAVGFVAKEIAFENTADVNMNQSVALANRGTFSAFYRCRFSGHQDTLYVKQDIQFFRDCDIYGTMDFIFANTRALFQNCNV